MFTHSDHSSSVSHRDCWFVKSMYFRLWSCDSLCWKSNFEVWHHLNFCLEVSGMPNFADRRYNWYNWYIGLADVRKPHQTHGNFSYKRYFFYFFCCCYFCLFPQLTVIFSFGSARTYLSNRIQILAKNIWVRGVLKNYDSTIFWYISGKLTTWLTRGKTSQKKNTYSFGHC